MSDTERTEVWTGSRHGGKKAIMDRMMQGMRGTILIVRPDGNNEVIEDIDHEVIVTKKLEP
jgi:hypothetical protein